jgi:hypothetical protein
MITDRIEQFDRPATTRPHLSRQRHVPRRHPVAEAAASVERAVQDLRAGVARAFRTLANGIEPRPAQAQSAAFYRSSGQLWARSLGVDENRLSRASVAAAFSAMARGADPDVAAEATLRFYRSSGAI